VAAAKNPLPRILPPNASENARVLILRNAANELIFGVVGHVGSGTSEIAKALQEILRDTTLPGGAFQVEILRARLSGTGPEKTVSRFPMKQSTGWTEQSGSKTLATRCAPGSHHPANATIPQ
jgi:hypothetical protein